jgi:hypothetical protein
VTIDVNDTIERGGAAMIQLLTYCVYMQKLDPMFQLLVKNYQLQPNGTKAIALYENFVSPQAPLLVSASQVVKSSDWQLSQTIDKILSVEQRVGQPISDEVEDSPLHVRHLPAKNIFDGIMKSVILNSSQFLSIESDYDPARTVVENLPTGQLTPAQRHFNEHIWKPSRQRFTGAGFFTIANIGG